jgi:hypothetical protein
MKLPQVKSFVIDTDENWGLGAYESDIADIINEYIVENEISSDDLVDIKISTCISENEDDRTSGLYCTVLLIYNKEIKE